MIKHLAISAAVVIVLASFSTHVISAEDNISPDGTTWRNNVSPSSIKLSIDTTTKNFESCPDVRFHVSIINGSSSEIVFDQGSEKPSQEVFVRDSNGNRVIGTQPTPTQNFSVGFLTIAPHNSAKLNDIVLGSIINPFANADCQPGTYTAEVRMNLAPGKFVIQSNRAPFTILPKVDL